MIVNKYSVWGERALVLIVTLRMISGGMDALLLPIAIPAISKEFGGEWASLLLMSQGVVLSGLLVLSGRMGDKLGLKRIFVIGSFLFLVGDVLSGYASSMEQLLIFRVLSSLGTTLSLAVAFPLLRVHIPEERRGRAFGFATAGTSIGLVIGPGLFGYCLQYLSWPVMFFSLIPFGVIIMGAGWYWIPRDSHERVSHTFDLPGAILLMIALSVMSLGLPISLHTQNITDVVITLTITGLFLFLFILWERKADNPIAEPDLLRLPDVRTPLFLTLGVYTIFFGYLYFAPVFLNEILMLSPVKSGVFIGLASVIPAVCNPLSGLFIERHGMKSIRVLIIGGSVAGILCCLSLFFLEILGGFNSIMLSLIFFGIFFACTRTSVYYYYYLSVPAEKAGTAGGILETGIEITSPISLMIVHLCFASGIIFGAGGIISTRNLSIDVIPGVQGIFLCFLVICIGMLIVMKRKGDADNQIK
ncbi:MAG: hypothetical protein CVV33_03275 [Methanomicrobiales archaeon HGW-Methanomicrobiales-4]|nr:MAG: hypothetical protein CVV33_03275 [Methanomicrobiales archaeon HGW-Methanomicrobiales-4]